MIRINNKEIKHIIWDWNGTLLNDVEVNVEVLNVLLMKRSLPNVTLKTYKENMSFPVRPYYDLLGFDFKNESFQGVCDEYIETYIGLFHKAQLNHNAREILQQIKGLGVEQSILSAAPQETLEHNIKHFGLLDYFIGLIGLSNNHGDSKVENGRAWINKLGLNANNVLLIGDTKHDNEVACNIGCSNLLVACGHYSRERLEECGTAIFEDLYGLQNYLTN